MPQHRPGRLVVLALAVAVALTSVMVVLALARGERLIAGLALLVLGCAAVATWRLVTGLLRPAARITSFAEAFADGDLTGSLPAGDAVELERLAHAVEAAAVRTRTAVRVMLDSGTALNASADLLAETSGSMASSFEQTSGQATAASTGADQVSQDVASVSTASAQLTGSVSEVARSAHEATLVADDAVAAAQGTSEVMRRLGDSSAEIGDVVKVITSIAAQTNLLALNATIEAARAGEAGRGFAVVANEVKELARETAAATEDISRRIDAIQADAGGAVEAIEAIQEVIGRIAAYQTTIAGAVEEQVSTAGQMSQTLTSAAAGSSDIAGNVQGVALAAEEALGQLSRTRGAANELATLAHDLSDVVQAFRLPQPEITMHEVGLAGGLACDVPGVVSVTLEPRLQAVVVRWLRYDDFAVKPALGRQLELIREHGLRTVVVDSREAVGAYSPAMNRWIGEDFVPRMQGTRVRLLVTVVPRSALADLANQEWQDGGQRSGLRMAEVASMADAERLAREVAGR